MKKTFVKRLTSVVLSAVLVCSILLPNLTAYADEQDLGTEVITEETDEDSSIEEDVENEGIVPETDAISEDDNVEEEDIPEQSVEDIHLLNSVNDDEDKDKDLQFLDETDSSEWMELTSDGGNLESGKYYLNGDVKLDNDITISSDADVTIDLMGHTLKGTGTASVITNRGTFTLEDSSEDGSGTLTGSTNKENYISGGGVYNAGNFTMTGGSISNNTTGGSGGGVYNSSTATFTMSGGSISNNTANYGGGVYNYNYSSGATFTMTGGSISDNTASSNGGGVYNSGSGATFTMTGGSISDNAANYGGGVYNTVTFTMSGGSISNNTAGSTYGGGGVYNSGSDATFTMDGGSISNNTANYGGGVYNYSSATFTMTGGSITMNKVTSSYGYGDGGGVYKYNNTLMYVSGNAVINNNYKDENISSNVYLDLSKKEDYPNGSYIQLAGDLTEGAYIGVTTSVEPTIGNPVEITCAESNTNYYESSAQYIYSDVGYFVRTNDNAHCVEMNADDEWILLTDGGTLISGKYYLENDLSLNADIVIPTGVDVIINLNGHALKGTGTASAITNYGTFTLEDSSEDGSGTLTGSTNKEYSVDGGGVYNNGIFIMNGGTICNNNVSGYGAGVYNYGSGATFTMTGGSISDNNGDGVYNYYRSAFTMIGGEISNNSGNGVRNSSYATFTMIGGLINGNGRGVYVWSNSEFTMTGGEISYNGGMYYSGGGVCVESSSTFTMTGGFIMYNHAGDIDSKSTGEGGGIYKYYNSNLFVGGDAIISNNMAVKYFYGEDWQTYYDYVEENVYIDLSYTDDYPTRSYIQLTEPLTDGACIGVTTSIEPTVDNHIQITSAEKSTNYYAESLDHFFSDKGYTIQANDNGKYVEMCYTGPTVTYNANGGSGNVPIDSTTYESGSTATVLGSGNLSFDGYHFAGWNTRSDGTGTTYQEGNTFSISDNVILYAQWEQHSYINSTVTFEWSDDLSSCTASATCDVCVEKSEFNCNVSEATTDPTCIDEGSTTYTASVTTGGNTYSDEKTKSIPALGHKFSGDPAYVTFTWENVSESSCTATFKCVDCDYTEDVTCDIETDNTNSKASCTEPGEILLTATAKIDSRDGEVISASEEKTIEVAALGHDWVVTFTWTDDYTATYNAVCKNDSNHTGSGTAEITHETTKAPTCTDSGVETYTANVTLDGEEYTDTTDARIEPLGHDYVKTVTEPTCTEGGYTTYTCNRCGDAYIDDYTDPLGHSWGEVVWGDWAESDDGGWDVSASRTCSRCNEIKDLDVTVERTTTDADCITPGTIIYTASVTVDGETIKCPDSITVTGVALGHDWYYGDEDVTWSESPEKGYTCTITFTCQNDNSHVGAVTASANKDSDKSVEPTCGEDGKYVYTASFTDPDGNRSYTESYEVTVVATGDHEYDYENPVYSWSDDYTSCTITCECKNCDAKCVINVPETAINKIEIDPTCTEDGTITYFFEYDDSEFGKTFSNSVTVTGKPATGHTPATDKAVEPTCTKTGLTEGSHCSVCDEILVAQEIIPATGHTWNEGEVTKDPTCTEDGEITYTCTVCEETKTESIDALGHNYTSEDVNFFWSDTEDSDFLTCEATFSCTDCDYSETVSCGISLDESSITATCTEEGEADYIASAVIASRDGNVSASDVKTLPYAALGHDWVETTEIIDENTTKVTLTCSRCGEIIEDVITVKTSSESGIGFQAETNWSELLTPEQIGMLGDDAEVDFVLTIEDANETVSDTDITLVESIVDTLDDVDSVAVFYLEIDLSMHLTINGDDTEYLLEEVPQAIKITITIPDELADDGEDEYDYYIVRVHDGEAELIPAEYQDDGTLTFSTDKFSTYAILRVVKAVEETPDEQTEDDETLPEQNEGSVTDDKNDSKGSSKADSKSGNTTDSKHEENADASATENADSPATGDESHILLWISVSLISLAVIAIAAVSVLRKRSRL